MEYNRWDSVLFLKIKQKNPEKMTIDQLIDAYYFVTCF